MKKPLETISKQQGTDNQRQLRGPRSDSPLPPAQLTSMYAYSLKRRVSILREQVIGNPSYNAEICVQISQFENQPWKKGQQILAIAFREIVAAEACYNRTCYKGYTRAKTSPTVASDGCDKLLEDEYANLESEAYQMLFDYIRSDVLTNEKIVSLTELTELLASYLTSLGVEDIKLSTKKHIRRNLQAELAMSSSLKIC